MTQKKGICYLIGAGPGDLGLFTIKAQQCIEQADVIIYDALCNHRFQIWAKPSCEMIYAGKRATQHTLKQDEINDLLVQHTAKNNIVVRLKGGDPMIFGRGGEEAMALAQANLLFEIVPGISSTIAGPAYAGIPVTHRDCCEDLTIFSAHLSPDKEQAQGLYRQIAQNKGTKVFVMGVSRLADICQHFIEQGIAADTPMALIEWATTPRQRSVTATVATMAVTAKEQNFQAPCVAVIGDVVSYSKELNWFEKKPLFGKRIVVTRSRSQASELSEKLEQLGAVALELPTIKTEATNDPQTFAECVANAHDYDWLFFTSPNGVERFFDAFFTIYPDARSLGGVSIACVGPGTAKKINSYRFAVDFIPKTHTAACLANEFLAEHTIENQKVLWVRPEKTNNDLFQTLHDAGGIVDQCISYRTIAETADPYGARICLAENGADIITFTSSSCVEHFHALNINLPDDCMIASIGPITSATLKKLGYPVDIEPFADQHHIQGLVEAIVDEI